MFKGRGHIFKNGLTATGAICAGEILGTIFAEANQGIGATADPSELAKSISGKGSRRTEKSVKHHGESIPGAFLLH